MQKTQTLKDYNQWRQAVSARVEALGRGARFRAARAIGTHGTLISSTLNGVLHRPDLLTKIEEWLDAGAPEKPA